MIPLALLYLFGPFSAALLRLRPPSGSRSIDASPTLQAAAIGSSVACGVLVSCAVLLTFFGPVISQGIMVSPPRPVVFMLGLLSLYVSGLVLWLLAKDAPRH